MVFKWFKPVIVEWFVILARTWIRNYSGDLNYNLKNCNIWITNFVAYLDIWYSNGSPVFRPPFKYQPGFQKAFEYWTIRHSDNFWLVEYQTSPRFRSPLLVIQSLSCLTCRLHYWWLKYQALGSSSGRGSITNVVQYSGHGFNNKQLWGIWIAHKLKIIFRCSGFQMLVVQILTVIKLINLNSIFCGRTCGPK